MSSSSTSRDGGGVAPASRSSGGHHGMPSARKTAVLVRRVGQRAQGVDPGGRARVLDEGGAEPVGRGDDELDRHALDRETHDPALVCGQQRHDLRQLGEPGQDGQRVVRGAHDDELLAGVPPAPRVAGHDPFECVRDRPDELARAIEQEPLAWPRLLRAGERFQQPRLRRRSDPGHGLQTPAVCRLAEFARRAHVERAGELQRPLRAQAEVAAEPHEVRRELAFELGELGERARVDELAQLRLDARPDPAQLPDPPRAHEVRDGHRRAADRLGGAPVRAGAVGVRLGELQQRRERVQVVGDARVVHATSVATPRATTVEGGCGVAVGEDHVGVVLQRLQVAPPERAVRVGRAQQLAGLRERGVHGLAVVVGARLVEGGDQLGEVRQPAEAQVLGGGLEELARAHAAAEAFDLHPLRLQEPAVQLEQGRARGGGVNAGVGQCHTTSIVARASTRSGGQDRHAAEAQGVGLRVVQAR